MLVPLNPTTPTWQRHHALTPDRFRLVPFRSPLLRESLLLSFPRATEMFQFARFPRLALCVQASVTPHDGCRVVPFGNPRVKAWSAAHRGISQPPTSFIGSRRQGIHRWLFVAWMSTKMLVLALQFSTYVTSSATIGVEDRTLARRLPPKGARLHPVGFLPSTCTPSKRNRGWADRTTYGEEDQVLAIPRGYGYGRPTSGQLGVSPSSESGCSLGIGYWKTP
jgi:hypothetical protein